MKIAHRLQPGQIEITIRGDVHEGTCGCLEKFWEFYVPDALEVLSLDMAEVDEIDAAGVAVLARMLEQHVSAGVALRLRALPQMLAHTLYKIGLTRSDAVRLSDIREEEPTAG